MRLPLRRAALASPISYLWRNETLSPRKVERALRRGLCPIHKHKLHRAAPLWVAQCCGLLIPVALLARLVQIRTVEDPAHYRVRHGGCVLVLENS